MSSHAAHELVTRNPFYVLGLPVDTTRSQIERIGQRLLAQLAVGAEAVKTYHTPLGEFERTPDLVRHALSELRDPASRLRHEIWRSEFSVEGSARLPNLAYPDAAGLIGWRNSWLSR